MQRAREREVQPFFCEKQKKKKFQNSCFIWICASLMLFSFVRPGREVFVSLRLPFVRLSFDDDAFQRL